MSPRPKAQGPKHVGKNIWGTYRDSSDMLPMAQAQFCSILTQVGRERGGGRLILGPAMIRVIFNTPPTQNRPLDQRWGSPKIQKIPPYPFLIQPPPPTPPLACIQQPPTQGWWLGKGLDLKPKEIVGLGATTNNNKTMGPTWDPRAPMGTP